MTSLLPRSSALARSGAPGQSEATDTARADRPAYLLCIYGSIVLSVLSGNSKLLHFPIGPDRVLLGVGLVLLFLDPVAWRTTALRLRTTHVCLLVLIAVIAVSGSLDGQLFNSFGFYALLDRIVVPLAYFTLAPVLLTTPDRRELLARFLVCLGLYLGFTALFEVLGPHSLVFPRFILDPNVGIGDNQARGPFTAPEADGMVMSCCAFVGALGFTRWSGRWRLAAGVTIGVCSFGAFLTLTRSIWVGFVIGVVLTGLADARLRPYLIRVVVLATVVLGLALTLSPALRNHATTRAGTSRSVYDRANTDDAALRILREHPLTGIGWVQFETESANYVRQAPTYPITTINIEVHNVVLSRAAELGIPAALVFVLALISGPLNGAVRRGKDADLNDWRLVLIAFGSLWLVVSLLSPLPYPLPNSLLWLLTGLVLTPHIGRPRSQSRLRPQVPARQPASWLPPTWPARNPVTRIGRRPSLAPAKTRTSVPRRPSA